MPGPNALATNMRATSQVKAGTLAPATHMKTKPAQKEKKVRKEKSRPHVKSKAESRDIPTKEEISRKSRPRLTIKEQLRLCKELTVVITRQDQEAVRRHLEQKAKEDVHLINNLATSTAPLSTTSAAGTARPRLRTGHPKYDQKET